MRSWRFGRAPAGTNAGGREWLLTAVVAPAGRASPGSSGRTAPGIGNLGRLVRAYERGMENQLGTLGPGLNAITWWTSLDINAAADRLEAGGLGVGPAIRARLSPLGFEHVNFHGSYPIHRPNLQGRLRDLRDPNVASGPAAARPGARRAGG